MTPKNEDTDIVDVLNIIRKLIKEYKLFLKILSIFFVTGFLYAIIIPNKFTSSVTFIPQINSSEVKPSSSLSGLASLAGINLSEMSTDNSIPPNLYPKIISSVNYRLELLSSKLISKQDITLREYLTSKNPSLIPLVKEYTLGLPGKIIKLFKDLLIKSEEYQGNYNIYVISEEDEDLFELLSEVLTIDVNPKEGFIVLSFKDENKFVSADVTKIAQNILEEKIIDFKIKSSSELLGFAQKQYEIKLSNHKSIQDSLALFIDKNQNISSSIIKNKIDRFNSRISISQNIVLQLANQVEQAKLQVSKETPIITTINDVNVPFEKSEPKRLLILIGFCIVGFIFSIIYIIYYDEIKIFVSKILIRD